MSRFSAAAVAISWLKIGDEGGDSIAANPSRPRRRAVVPNGPLFSSRLCKDGAEKLFGVIDSTHKMVTAMSQAGRPFQQHKNFDKTTRDNLAQALLIRALRSTSFDAPVLLPILSGLLRDATDVQDSMLLSCQVFSKGKATSIGYISDIRRSLAIHTFHSHRLITECMKSMTQKSSFQRHTRTLGITKVEVFDHCDLLRHQMCSMCR